MEAWVEEPTKSCIFHFAGSSTNQRLYAKVFYLEKSRTFIGGYKCKCTFPKVQEWFNKASKFDDMTKAVKRMADKLLKVNNRSLLYELYPYVWDMRGVISLLNSYIEWLGKNSIESFFFSL